MIKVLVVDDSYFMRELISELLSSDPEIDVVDTAKNGREALAKLETQKPDVITMDYVMPSMSGLATLKKIMNTHPTPVVMVSAYTKEGAAVTFECLAAGAVGFVLKPSGQISLDIGEVKTQLINEVKAAGTVRVQRLKNLLAERPTKQKVEPPVVTTAKIVVIGSSTGGPPALELLLSSFPFNVPAGILVVQHMPPKFTKYLAERLDKKCDVDIKEAENGDVIEAGKVFVAPGGFHMLVEKKEIGGESKVVICLNKNPPVHELRPSIDITMNSVASTYGHNAVGIILTGMGMDGSEGMASIKKRGGATIVQDEASSLIFSMPKHVIDGNNADFVLSISQISEKLMDVLRS